MIFVRSFNVLFVTIPIERILKSFKFSVSIKFFFKKSIDCIDFLEPSGNSSNL
ncbi:hypothetical protein AP058_00004 [Flavobacterium sp. TAB 87]|nr:hypothetical protein AP058_00004 [Flavobacterium sp. TAB 87]